MSVSAWALDSGAFTVLPNCLIRKDPGLQWLIKVSFSVDGFPLAPWFWKQGDVESGGPAAGPHGLARWAGGAVSTPCRELRRRSAPEPGHYLAIEAAPKFVPPPWSIGGGGSRLGGGCRVYWATGHRLPRQSCRGPWRGLPNSGDCTNTGGRSGPRAGYGAA